VNMRMPGLLLCSDMVVAQGAGSKSFFLPCYACLCWSARSCAPSCLMLPPDRPCCPLTGGALPCRYAYLGVDPCSAQQKQHLDRVLGIAAPPAAAPGRPPPPPGASLEAWGGMPAGPDPELLKSLPPPVAHLLASLPPAMVSRVPDSTMLGAAACALELCSCIHCSCM
jgi:hypothetical protein